MFYCEDCANRNGWFFEDWMGKSRGPCELCKRVALCVDVRSDRLPSAPKSGNPSWEEDLVRSGNPLWSNDEIQFARLIAEINATQTVDWEALGESMDLDPKHLHQLFDRAEARWEKAKKMHCPSPDDEPCDECDGRGFFFPWRDDTGYACVEKCDACGRFTWDDEAAAELGRLVLPKGYAVASICLPGMRWEQAGAAAFVVCQFRAESCSYVPLSFEAGIKLARELGLEKATGRLCCPKCGSTDLFVQLPAVFSWDGEAYAVGPEDLRSDEFPIEEDALVVCNGQPDEKTCSRCDYTCKVSDLVPK